MIGVCEQERAILTIIYCVIGGILVAVGLCMIGTFFNHVRQISAKSGKAKQKNSKLVISSKILLFLSIMYCMVMHCVFVGNLCSHDSNSIYDDLSNFDYVLQAFLMLIAWFIRLYSAFKGTILQIHEATMFIFLSIATSVFIFGVILGFDRDLVHANLHGQNFYYVIFVLAAIFVMLILFLCGLFIYKLVQVYKNLGSDEEFIKIITKITILNFTSLFITIISVSSTIGFHISVYGEFINHFAILFNYFSNFICVIFSYTYYTGSYNRYCGWMNNKCNACWYQLLTGKKIEVKLSRMKSGSIHSVASKTVTVTTTRTDNTENIGNVMPSTGIGNESPVTDTDANFGSCDIMMSSGDEEEITKQNSNSDRGGARMNKLTESGQSVEPQDDGIMIIEEEKSEHGDKEEINDNDEDPYPMVPSLFLGTESTQL